MEKRKTILIKRIASANPESELSTLTSKVLAKTTAQTAKEFEQDFLKEIESFRNEKQKHFLSAKRHISMSEAEKILFGGQ